MVTSQAAQEDFKQRRGTSGKNRVWQYIPDLRISIRERENASGGVGYRVTLPKGVTGGRVIFLQSRDFEQAKAMARSKSREFRESRSTALVLGDAQKIQAASAIKTLKEAGLSLGLDDMARQYAEAVKHLTDLEVALPEAAKGFAEASRTVKVTGKTLGQVVEFGVARLAPAGGTKTVAEVAEEMIKVKAGWLKRGDLRPASFRDFENRAGRIAADIGSLPLAELSKTTVLAWLQGLGLSPRTVKNYRMVLAELLRYAQQKRYLVDNPIDELTRADVKEIEGRGVEGQQPSILSPAQAEKLLNAAFDHPELDLGAAVVLALFGGIRTEELKRLTWDALRLEEEHPFVVIGPEIAKKRRIRNVPIPECAVAWLQRWNRGDKITRSSHTNDYQKRFKKLYTFAGITWEANSMRHSFGSYHYAKYGNGIETARILGHKADDTVLFAHYRALTSKPEAETYFGIMPRQSGTKIVRFSPAV